MRTFEELQIDIKNTRESFTESYLKDNNFSTLDFDLVEHAADTGWRAGYTHGVNTLRIELTESIKLYFQSLKEL